MRARQFARIERLRQVIVGAELQADDAVHILAARGQHDDRDLALLAQAAQDLEAIDAGQHDVEHHQVHARCEGAFSRPRLPSCSAVDGEAFALQEFAEQGARVPRHHRPAGCAHLMIYHARTGRT